jgi:hypothetical protein
VDAGEALEAPADEDEPPPPPKQDAKPSQLSLF